MTRLRISLVVGIVLLGTIIIILWIADARIRESKQFQDKHAVTTSSQTNYLAQLLGTSIGRTDSGLTLLLYLRVENPNSQPLLIERSSFVITDSLNNQYTPVTKGIERPVIRLAPKGVNEKEILSYTLKDEALHGIISLNLGYEYKVTIKNNIPFQEPLRAGEFRSFLSSNWR